MTTSDQYLDIGLNIALLIVGTLATVAAFGGESWKKGRAPLLRRITVRGWASLSCLATALAIGVYKEVRTSAKEERNSRHTATLELQQQQAADLLADSKAKLARLTLQLGDTTQQLPSQLEMNLLMGLSTGHSVSEVSIVVTLPKGAGSAQDRIELIFPGIPAALRELVRVQTFVHPFTGVYTVMKSTYGTNGKVAIGRGDDRGDGAVPLNVTDPPCLSHVFGFPHNPKACANSEEQRLFLATPVNPQKDRALPSVAMAQLSDPEDDHTAVKFRLRLSKSFLSTDEIAAFMAKHSDLKELERKLPIFFGRQRIGNYEVTFQIPPAIRDTIKNYWKATGSGSLINVFLGKTKDLKISCALKAIVTDENGGELSVELDPSSKPTISLGFSEL